MMRLLRLCFLLAVAAVAPLHADATWPAGDWDLVRIAPVKTSIYVGNVTLTTSDFHREGDHFTATYEAKVWPWAWWNETGKIAITFSAADRERLARGERVDFSGDAANHKNKARHISGWAERRDPANGKMKVRIGVDDAELIFNSTYRLPNVRR